ncbi:hypothetical protein BBP18_09085 [Bacillus velezensis]|nr:hypothetical protein U722_09760 [Bacillus amyloliquefaciens LFB112]OPD42519.1 hypothetical protein BVF98_15665 [Bacillus amyloliquefaciens]PII40910.1 hypothetical protein BBP18_09085 [Bacillus velezensis]
MKTKSQSCWQINKKGRILRGFGFFDVCKTLYCDYESIFSKSNIGNILPFFYMILSYLFTDFSFFIIKFLFGKQNLFKSAINYTFYSLL